MTGTMPAVAGPDFKGRLLQLYPGKWLLGLIALQIVCQVALLSSQIGPLRVLVRSAALGASAAYLFLIPGKSRPHPSSTAAIVVLLILGAAFFHPSTNNVISGLAEIGLYVAILAPIFWTTRLDITQPVLVKVVMVLWLFHTVSATVGILQVYIPGFPQPHLSIATQARGDLYVEDLKMTNAAGATVFRPMGLTDMPGGAAIAGFYSVLFGLGFLLHFRRLLPRLFALASILAGTACIMLSMSRSVLIMLCFCGLAFCVLLLVREEVGKLSTIAISAALVATLSFGLAVAVGGGSVLKRLHSLTEREPGEVYQSNRGRFLQHTIDDLLPEYPLGAGLGRWGMINAYFADNSDPKRCEIWAEIMWTGWLIDGGVPLIIAYVAAIAAALLTSWRITMWRGSGGLWLWGAVITAYNLGAVVMTFSYPFFIGQPGLELWMLNGALYAASRPRCWYTPVGEG
jgi:hypothetical protein